MDLLFKRYASPFLLLNQMLKAGRLYEFIDTLVGYDEEEKAWEMYLHTIYAHRKNFNEFMNPVKQPVTMSDTELEATIKTTNNLLNNFKPTKKEVNK